MASISNDIKVTTIERDEKRYKEAVKNIESFNLEQQINIIFNDAFDVELNEQYDLIFIDAAKSQYIKFFLKYQDMDSFLLIYPTIRRNRITYLLLKFHIQLFDFLPALFFLKILTRHKNKAQNYCNKYVDSFFHFSLSNFLFIINS